MKTKELVIMALFVGIGAILHSVIPGIGNGGMKPDFSLVMLFLGIILFPDKKNAVLLGLATGIIAGMTTSFPGGFIPNVIDKFITALVFYGLFMLVKKNRTIISNAILTAIGTIISGTIFLFTAILLTGFEGSFFALFTLIVLPTTAFNTVSMVIVYPIVSNIAKRSKFNLA